ncbi:hypothetical protein ABPG75_005193 [Micractinium tetrahymenae]
MDYCEAALGALLPELDFGSQMWQSSSSFYDLDMVSMDVTESGSAGCWDVLLQGADEELSSKLLCQELALSQPPTTIHAAFLGCHPADIACSPASTLHQCSASQGCSPATSASLGSLPSHASAPQAATSTATARSSPMLCESTASRAVTPEPQLPEADQGDAEAVRLAALALQMSQGNVNAAMAQLLNWAGAQ